TDVNSGVSCTEFRFNDDSFPKPTTTNWLFHIGVNGWIENARSENSTLCPTESKLAAVTPDGNCRNAIFAPDAIVCQTRPLSLGAPAHDVSCKCTPAIPASVRLCACIPVNCPTTSAVPELSRVLLSFGCSLL